MTTIHTTEIRAKSLLEMTYDELKAHYEYENERDRRTVDQLKESDPSKVREIIVLYERRKISRERFLALRRAE